MAREQCGIWGAVLLAALVVPCSGRNGGLESQPRSPIVSAAQEALSERDDVIAEVLSWLSSMDEVPSEQNAATTQAMRFLAEVRSPESVPALRKHCMFLRFSPFSDWPTDFAAIAALANLGLPGVPALISISAEGYGGQDVDYPVSLLAASMPCPVIVAGMFDLAAAREPDAARAARLRRAAAYVRRENDGSGVAPIRPPLGPGDLPEFLAAEVPTALQHQRRAIKALAEWLLSTDSIPPEQRADVAEAIAVLGELRSPEAIEALRKHAFFVTTEPPKGPGDFVALNALAKINLPAIPALIDVAAEGREGKGVDDLLVPILASLAPPQVVADYVEQVAKDEIDPDRYARLSKLAEGLRARAGEQQ